MYICKYSYILTSLSSKSCSIIPCRNSLSTWTYRYKH